jgi:hypothetical protein
LGKLRDIIDYKIPLASLLICLIPLVFGSGLLYRQHEIKNNEANLALNKTNLELNKTNLELNKTNFDLNKTNQIISIRQQYDPLIEKSFQLVEEYRSIINKYPDVMFQDTDVGFVSTGDVGFIKISKEDIEKLSTLEKRFSLLKENFKVYEAKLSHLEGRKPKNIKQILRESISDNH